MGSRRNYLEGSNGQEDTPNSLTLTVLDGELAGMFLLGILLDSQLRILQDSSDLPGSR